jgi:hypothetical protein
MEIIIDTNKEVGLKVKAEGRKHMLLSHHQNAGRKSGHKVF